MKKSHENYAFGGVEICFLIFVYRFRGKEQKGIRRQIIKLVVYQSAMSELLFRFTVRHPPTPSSLYWSLFTFCYSNPSGCYGIPKFRGWGDCTTERIDIFLRLKNDELWKKERDPYEKTITGNRQNFMKQEKI